MWSLAGVGVAGVATVLTLSTGAGTGAAGRAAAGSGGGTAAEPQAQNVSFAMAAKETAQTNFHVTITQHMQGTQDASDLIIAGADDPALQNAYLDQVSKGDFAAFGKIREVAGTCYQGKSVPSAGGGSVWTWEKATCGWPEPGGPGTIVSPIGNPDAFLEQLAADGSAKLVSQTGHGVDEMDVWSYSSTSTKDSQQGGATVTYTGTATVDVATHHVIILTETESVAGGGPSAITATFYFSDFGAPIAPITAIVAATGAPAN